MAYSYRYLEDRASLPSTSSSSCSDTGESSRTSTSYSDDLRKELRTADPDFDDLHYPFPAQPTSSPSFIRRHPVFCSIASIFWGCIAGIHIAYPFPTTIPVFVGAALGLLAFTTLDWYRLFTSIYASRRRSDTPSPPASPCIAPTTRCSNDTPRPPPYTPHPQSTVNVSRVRKIRLIVSTALILFWLHLGITPPAEHVPVLHRSVPSRPEKYFIAANMYNNEDVFEGWSQELLKLCDYLGHNSTFISIYESNSVDSTPELLDKFSQRLTHVNIPHRFVSTTDDNRHWSYSTSQERIQYLADVRNKAMEPLQSADDNVRLADWEDFTRVIFINDVIYKWESVVRLIATRLDEDETKAGEYDLACGLDFAISGLYDTWVARDICGTPFRIFWPYAKDQLSIDRIKKEKPVEVAACWNGVVVFPAKPYMYKPPVDTHMKVQKRSWRMIDNSTYPGSVSSPAISNPPKFRSTGIEACDHSECFLFSYDLHRIHNTRERPPRILINPTVKVAYKKHWFRWHTTVLRIPAIKWWLELWSRGYPFKIVEWMWEYGSRRRDYCTWSAFNMPDRCPKLPGAWDMSWNEG